MDTNTLLKALAKWGRQSQIEMAVEECAELQVALAHHKRGRNTDAEVCSEIADVMIMMEQLRLIFGPSMVDDAIATKMTRLKGRINA